MDDALDFFQFRKNSIAIQVGNAPCANDFSVAFIQYKDTTFLFKNGVQVAKSTPDWYGKECIFILKGDTVLSTHRFPDYKLISWDKIKYNLLIEQMNSGECLLKWSLESTKMSNSGCDTLR